MFTGVREAHKLSVGGNGAWGAIASQDIQGAPMAEDRNDLYEALTAHKSALEIIRDSASAPSLEVLDSRIAAVQSLLEWLAQALEPQPPASPKAQTPPSSGSQADQR
jgi:hypothetical protein